jgi:ABC-type multidrug transport system permease subunit
MSLELGILYNVIYLFFACKFGLMLFNNEDGPMGAFEVMFFAYNLILHLPILPVNAVIIIKEIQLERI